MASILLLPRYVMNIVENEQYGRTNVCKEGDSMGK